MFYARAMAEEKLKQLDEAEADIQAALKLSPEQPELLNYLGYSWVDQEPQYSRGADHAGKGARLAAL